MLISKMVISKPVLQEVTGTVIHPITIFKVMPDNGGKRQNVFGYIHSPSFFLSSVRNILFEFLRRVKLQT